MTVKKTAMVVARAPVVLAMGDGSGETRTARSLWCSPAMGRRGRRFEEEDAWEKDFIA